MLRAADAIVTGFAKSRALAEQCLAPVRHLRQEGIFRRIVCVTWDNPETDTYAAWIDDMADVSLVRVPQPCAGGTSNQRGVVYQIENLRAALALLPNDDDIVFKLRPDFACDAEFVREKIATFESWSEVHSNALGIRMPKPLLRHKIWVPWADCNQPFYYEDAAFCGTRRDLKHLVTRLTGSDIAILADASCGSFVHVVRFARPFLGAYPLFSRYLGEYRAFLSDHDYRRQLIPHLLDDGFFWFLLVAHAWILYSQFHVDAGEAKTLRFYSNTANANADWTRTELLKLANPYDDLDIWRNGTHPGEATHSLRRLFGRLVDDAWQTELFTKPRPDFPRTALVGLLENIAGSRDGRLKDIEGNFYRNLARFHQTHAPGAAAPG
ncbi:MAG TPA: hypothetical protein VGF97_05415 [Rhizomicrobium sp.]|jgi:hypothetical protein